MLLSQQIAGFAGRGSVIRKMFEAGLEMKKKYGSDAVCDFSLGNPDLPPPPEVQKELMKIAEKSGEPFALGYVPNAGMPAARAAVAAQLQKEQDAPVTADDVIITCGAAGALNVLFRAILAPGDEILTIAPYFVEYGFYAGNFGGKLIGVPAKEGTFELDCDAVERAITPRTKGLIINSPNNPTGRIYSREELTRLAGVLRAKEKELGHEILLISDEPYRFLNYDNLEIPSVFRLYEHSIIGGSYSKSLSLAGERIGFLAVNPAMGHPADFLGGLILCNRILGFVNAPVIAQKLLLNCASLQGDLEIYRARRQAMKELLERAGIEFPMPQGAFYFFAKSPVPDENVFVQALLEERILAVPGSGFGKSGYVRLAFCVEESVIRRAFGGMKRAADKVRALANQQ